MVSFSPLELFLSQKAPARSSRKLLYLLVAASWNPQAWWSWADIPYKSCYCHKRLLREATAGCCISSSFFLETPNRGGVGQLSSIWAVIVARSSCAEQSQVVVSPRCYFVRLPTGVELGSNIKNTRLLHKRCLFAGGSSSAPKSIYGHLENSLLLGEASKSSISSSSNSIRHFFQKTSFAFIHLITGL